MLNVGEIYEIDSFLTETERNKVEEEFDSIDWKFIAGELQVRKSGVPVRKFWYKELSEATYIKQIFKSKIQSTLGCEILTARVYGNGQAHGQSAWPHTDYSEVGGKYGSMVYYLHRNWLPQYGGHLMFLDAVDNPKKVLKSIFPTENSAVMFNADMPHMALEPSVYCLEQRLSIAFKFKVLE